MGFHQENNNNQTILEEVSYPLGLIKLPPLHSVLVFNSLCALRINNGEKLKTTIKQKEDKMN